MQARRQWKGISKLLKENKNGEPRILKPVEKISLKNKGKIKTFSDFKKLREVSASRFFTTINVKKNIFRLKEKKQTESQAYLRNGEF